MELFQRLSPWPSQKSRHSSTHVSALNPWQTFLLFLEQIRSIGFSAEMDDYEKRKLGIFNQLNFFQLITGIIFPVIILLNTSKFPAHACIIAILPALVSIAVLVMNSKGQHERGLLFYFVFYPLFTCIIYINGFNLGVELSFVLYGILSVFFLKEIGYMIFSIAFSMISYFVLSVVLKNYQYQLKSLNLYAYLLNQLLAIGYIFYGLYLIKKENAGYQLGMIKQKAEMQEQALLLQQQAGKLEELNSLKNKLFSVISHDLKAPMYALRNMFSNAQQMKLTAKEIKGMLPDVINDLNYTTGLMENLLQWAKSQMQSNEVRPHHLDINVMIEDVIHVMHLQAAAKKIVIERKSDMPVYAWADQDMINLVLRNLLSNAIKFTPAGSHIFIGTNSYDTFIEVYIQDAGIGISPEEMKKINENIFYTTNGTASETGTGLGLMLCKEFLTANGGNMMIESEPGKGSTFSFTLPQPA